MLRATTDIGIQVLKHRKHITQGMLIARSSHYTYPSTESYFVDNLIHSNVVQLRNVSSIPHIILRDPKRQFSRSSSLQHDIKCVTNSYYEDLGLESSATSKEIKDAFYRQEIHEDHGIFGSPVNI